VNDHAWTCPRCSTAPEHPYECPCGLSRKGWHGGTLEYRYPHTDNGAVQKDAYVLVTRGRTETHVVLECETCRTTTCEEADDVLLDTYPEERFDL
jgi:hypothetical protein